MSAQFGASAVVFRSFGRIRRTRNSFEYPGADTPGPSLDDVDDTITVATRAREAAATILDQSLLTPW